MNYEEWNQRGYAIIALCSGASSDQLGELLQEINDLLTAQLEVEESQMREDDAELEVDLTLDGEVRMVPKESDGQ